MTFRPYRPKSSVTTRSGVPTRLMFAKPASIAPMHAAAVAYGTKPSTPYTSQLVMNASPGSFAYVVALSGVQRSTPSAPVAFTYSFRYRQYVTTDLSGRDPPFGSCVPCVATLCSGSPACHASNTAMPAAGALGRRDELRGAWMRIGEAGRHRTAHARARTMRCERPPTCRAHALDGPDDSNALS